jgi:hypothetical protein
MPESAPFLEQLFHRPLDPWVWPLPVLCFAPTNSKNTIGLLLPSSAHKTTPLPVGCIHGIEAFKKKIDAFLVDEECYFLTVQFGRD